MIGSNLAEHLVNKGWEVYGLARKPQTGISGVRPIVADMLEPQGLRATLSDINPTHVFLTAWVRKASEDENIAANAAMVRNVLAALDRSAGLRYVALVTGLKHYLGPFEYYAKLKPDIPLREEMPRLPSPNFFYAQEDELFEAARRKGFTWSVHRSHTTWAKIAAKYGLAEADLGKLTSAWHTDMDLGREIEVVTDMTKSRWRVFTNTSRH